MSNPKLTFYGGVGSATGANILLDFNKKRIAVDCGLLQGGQEEKNFEAFKYDPAGVDFLLITHAHLDHIGKVPKFVRDGFKGQIISTKETMEIARPVLDDALRVMQSRHSNRTLFDQSDIEKTFSLWQGGNYEEKINLFDNCFLEMQDAGHILGSAIFNVTCDSIKVAFTGDLGNSPSPLLPDTEFVKNADYIVMESVYGDRNHESKEERREKLKQAILGGIKKGGAIVIPVFSIEKTQVLLYEINHLVEGKEIPEIPVFLDSPLAIKVTDIYKKYQKDFKQSVKEEIKKGDDIFDFPKLHIVKQASESADIENVKGAKIILAGSGMSEGGRVVNHEIHYLPDPSATIILIGYQVAGTLGRMIEDGAKEVEITSPLASRSPLLDAGEGRKERKFSGRQKIKIKVRAKIEVIKGYSAHKDSEHLVEFVEKSAPRHVFVIMGEPKSSLFLCQRIRDYLDIDAVYPEEGKEYELKSSPQS